MAAIPKKTSAKHAPFDMQEHFSDLMAAMRGRYAFLNSDLTDTEVVLMATALLDRFLSFYLTISFRPDNVSKARMAEVFKGNGPLATFSAKITVGTLMGFLIEEQTHDFKILKDIRNEFAHSPQVRSLKEMASCDNLRLRHQNIPVPKGDRRAAFVSSASQMVVYCSIGAAQLFARQHFLSEHSEEVKKLAENLVAQMLAERPPESA